MSQIKEITEIDKKAYKLYIDDSGDHPVMSIESFAERNYNFVEVYYTEASWRYRKEKLNKLL